MAQSDTALLADLTARVERLEQLVAEMRPKELHGDLYGPETDHTADREARRSFAGEPRSGEAAAALGAARAGRPKGS